MSRLRGWAGRSVDRSWSGFERRHSLADRPHRGLCRPRRAACERLTQGSPPDHPRFIDASTGAMSRARPGSSRHDPRMPSRSLSPHSPPAEVASVVDFSLSEENRLVHHGARAFVEADILPHIREWDEKGEVHREVFGRRAELGFLGAPIPERYGGSGMDYISFALLCEELERGDTAFRVVQSVHVGLNSLALLQWGSEEQRQRWLVPQARGERLATFGLTEPGTGTDAANLATTARRSGDVYRLNGQKVWISLADLADHFLVFASVDRARKHKGITAFMVERGMPGLTTGTLHGKLGIRAGNTGLINLGLRNTRETSLAKWHATEHAVQSALDAIQVHGANGYSNEFPVERYLRNSKAAVIYEGTSQLHTLIQADYALGYREDRPLRCEPLPAEGFERLPATTAVAAGRA